MEEDRKRTTWGRRQDSWEHGGRVRVYPRADPWAVCEKWVLMEGPRALSGSRPGGITKDQEPLWRHLLHDALMVNLATRLLPSSPDYSRATASLTAHLFCSKETASGANKQQRSRFRSPKSPSSAVLPWGCQIHRREIPPSRKPEDGRGKSCIEGSRPVG